MKLLRKIMVLALLVLSMNKLSAQDTAFIQGASTRFKTASTSLSLLSPQRFHYSFQLGTGFMASKFGSGFFTSLSPGFNYTVTPKFSIEAGGIFTTGYANYLPLRLTESGSPQLGRTSQFFVYASGHYMLSDKLTFTGTAYKEVNPNHGLQMNPYFLNYKGGSMGLDYKLSDHVTISTTIGFSNHDRLYNLNGNSFPSPGQLYPYGW